MFFVSLILVLISTFFITSVLSKNAKQNLFFIYFLLISFAQIVLSFEILSLYSLISSNNFLFVNSFFLISSFILWKCKKSPIPIFCLKDEFKKIRNALILDKCLLILSVFFIFFIVVELVDIFVTPVSWGDALSYYFTRCAAWIEQRNINHYVTPDVRELIMPVNMEFLYTWVFLLLKNERGTAIFSFISYIASIYLIYNLLGTFKFSIRKRLWAIFIFSSFALIGSLVSIPSADIFIGALILASVYLFYEFSKNNDKTALYFSTLSYALAVGTKTTALIVFPLIFVLFVILLYKNEKKSLLKNIFYFLVLLFFNFIIFSSYNYILNFIQFANPVSNETHVLLNKFFGGFKGYLFNVLKYVFVFFDAAGIQNFDLYNQFITSLQEKVFQILGMTPTEYLSVYYDEDYKFTSKISPLNGFLGILGLFAFVPALVISILKLFKTGIKSRTFLINSLGILFVFNILLFSGLMIFTNLNMRYLITFVVISAPVLVFIYPKASKKLYKYILSFLVFYYLFYLPAINELPYFFYRFKDINRLKWADIVREEMIINNYLSDKKDKKILLYISGRETSRFDIEKLKLKGFIVDKLLLENLGEYDISEYDYIVANTYELESSFVLGTGSNICEYYDVNKKSLDNNLKAETVKVVCKIPFEYFEQKGFVKVDDIKPVVSNYKFYKKK